MHCSLKNLTKQHLKQTLLSSDSSRGNDTFWTAQPLPALEEAALDSKLVVIEPLAPACTSVVLNCKTFSPKEY